MQKGFDAITIGSSTIDFFVYTDNSLIKIKTAGGEEELIAYPSGSKILVKRFLVQTGGGGTNAAATFAKMGLSTGWIGAVGDDEHGEKVLDEMKRRRIAFLGKRIHGMTGTSVILDSIEHDRTVLAYKGVNELFTAKNIDLKAIDAKLVYLTSFTGKSFDVYAKILPYLKKRGILSVLNPSTYLAKMGSRKLAAILKHVDVLVCNDEEAGLLSGEKELKQMAKAIASYGPKIVLITCGPRGVVAYDRKHFYRCDAPPIKVAESLGAGDAFGAGFCAAYLKTGHVECAIAIGMANAESAIQHIGAKVGLLTWQQALQRAKSHHVKKQVI